MGATIQHWGAQPLKNAQENYEIRIKGHLDPHRLTQYQNLAVTHHPNGETILVITNLDQSAFYGILSWLQNIGIQLLSVQLLETGNSNGGHYGRSKRWKLHYLIISLQLSFNERILNRWWVKCFINDIFAWPLIVVITKYNWYSPRVVNIYYDIGIIL